jgi:putative Holliday junction resolvase
MGRILGLDVGSKRIGIALSDELHVLASPRGALTRTNLNADLRALGTIVSENEVERIVVGHPISLGAQASQQTQQVEKFAARLAGVIDVPVELWDERRTTAMAIGITGSSREARESGRRDAVAAAFILQGYLDRREAAAY